MDGVCVEGHQPPFGHDAADVEIVVSSQSLLTVVEYQPPIIVNPHLLRPLRL